MKNERFNESDFMVALLEPLVDPLGNVLCSKTYFNKEKIFRVKWLPIHVFFMIWHLNLKPIFQLRLLGKKVR